MSVTRHVCLTSSWRTQRVAASRARRSVQRDRSRLRSARVRVTRGAGRVPVPLPVGAEWTTGCNFVCVAGLYSSAPGTCTECTSSCDCGEYLSGACGGVLNYECLVCENLGAEQYFTSNGTVINGAGSCGIADCRAECVGGNVLEGECGGCSNRICEGAGENPPNSSFPLVCTFRRLDVR